MKINMKKLLLLLGLIFNLVGFSQTTLINPIGPGGFQVGANFPANGWNVVNGAQTNQWFCNTPNPAAPFAGTNCAYISNNATGTTYNYNNASASVVHFYRDIWFPPGEIYINLSFKWKGTGESSFDYLQVFLVPTTTIPIAGTQLVTGQLGTNLNLQAAWQTANFTLPCVGVAGTTQRLVFTWRNDGSLGAQFPGAIDNISLISNSVGPTCLSLLGTGVTNIAALPYASGAGTTCGAVNDLISTNVATCGSTLYLGGEDKVWIFTPTSTGQITINLTSTGSYTGLMLYDGCPMTTVCSGLPGNCVGSAQSSAGNQTLAACVTAGITYYLILDSWPAPTCNPYTNLTISSPTPPGSCIAALGTCVTVVGGLPYSTGPGTTCGCVDDQTSSNTEICGSTLYSSGEDKVWVFTPATSGAITINLTSSGSYTSLTLFDGCPLTSMCSGSPGNCVGSSQSSLGNQSISVCVTAGVTYYLILDSWNPPSCNAYSDLTISAPISIACGYTTSFIGYAPDAYGAGTILTFPDDLHSAIIPIGFTFCFFGTTYNNIVVSSNGYLSFNTANAGVYSPWATVPIPTSTPAEVVNSIMGPWQDIDPSIGVGSDIRYNVYGVMPNRRFVVAFQNIPYFSGTCNTILFTGEIILYETTNVIENHIQSKPICSSWNGGNAVQGLNGPGGCNFVAVPGRNNTQFTLTNDAVRYTPTGCCSVLPIELTSFDAICDKGDVILKWSTASQTNNDYFTIERTVDGTLYEVVDTIHGAGTNNQTLNYSFIDRNPHNGTSYYRLKQTDFNGISKYYNLIAVTCNILDFIIYPNPNTGNFIVEGVKSNSDLTVTDMLGQIVYYTKVNSDKLELNLSLSKGVYFIKIESGEKNVIKKIIVK